MHRRGRSDRGGAWESGVRDDFARGDLFDEEDVHASLYHHFRRCAGNSGYVIHVDALKHQPKLGGMSPNIMICSEKRIERLNQEIRRRERVIRIFPNEASVIRLLGALLMEQHEEWITGHRYFNMAAYWEWKASENQATGQNTTAEEARIV